MQIRRGLNDKCLSPIPSLKSSEDNVGRLGPSAGKARTQEGRERVIQGGRHLQPGLGEAAARQPRRLQWSQGSSEGGAAGAHGSQEQEVALRSPAP